MAAPSPDFPCVTLVAGPGEVVVFVILKRLQTTHSVSVGYNPRVSACVSQVGFQNQNLA
jgi:hypothetical protein